MGSYFRSRRTGRYLAATMVFSKYRCRRCRMKGAANTSGTRKNFGEFASGGVYGQCTRGDLCLTFVRPQVSY